MARPLPLVPPCLRHLHPGPHGQERAFSKAGWRHLRGLPAAVGWPSASSLTRVSPHYFQIGHLLHFRSSFDQGVLGTHLYRSDPLPSGPAEGVQACPLGH